MPRVKVSVSVDPDLLNAVDSFVREHDELDRSKVIDQALKVNVESGETLRDSIAQYWRQVNRQYTDQYPGHERVAAWLEEWVYGLSDHEEYVRKLGSETLERIKPGVAPAASVDYGAYR